MRRLVTVFALFLGLFSASSAHAAKGHWGTDLRFVATTSIPGAQPISVCHLVEYAEVLFVPVFTSVQGYALSTDNCNGMMYRDLSTEAFADLQASGMVPADLPATPRLSPRDWVAGHAILIIGAFAAFVRGFVWLFGADRRSRRKPKAPDALAIHSLVAMSQIAVADGKIGTKEVQEIASILTRLTGQGYSLERVQKMLSQLNPSHSDMTQVGQDLSQADRQIVLEAALNIAVADGEIHPSEYAVVSDLAHRMRIGADAFRTTLNRIAAHLQSTQTA